MNKDIVKGKVKQAEGRVRDALGDLTDDPRDDVRGKAKVAEGKIQEGIGKTRRAIKKAVD